ncbi:MAG: flagellar hook-basal body protein, partial [Bacillota bacterium]|nr:flagellar hook-basal body protein [Bacillota bacterium]
MKAMWSAASGMKNLQLKIDTVSNNLANVQTFGFKSRRVEFKDIMYERMTSSDRVVDEGRPVPMEIGHGVMAGATLRSSTQGNLQQTENRTDFAISGDHFFKVIDINGNTRYTRDGSFKISTGENGTTLVTSEGFYVQGLDGNIEFGENVVDIKVDFAGKISVKRAGVETYEEIGQFSLNKFLNPAGMESVGK